MLKKGQWREGKEGKDEGEEWGKSGVAGKVLSEMRLIWMGEEGM